VRGFIPNKRKGSYHEASTPTYDRLVGQKCNNNNGNVGTWEFHIPDLRYVFFVEQSSSLKAVSPQACIADFF
jgi:hypothetical protein